MKKLFLLWLFSGSLDGFSQVNRTLEYPPKPVTIEVTKPIGMADLNPALKPDTLRADLLITQGTMGVAHKISGYVVKSPWKEEVFLDDRKWVIKAPVTVWGFKIKK